MIGPSAARRVLPTPCEACGGEVVTRASPDPTGVRRACLHCGASAFTPFSPGRAAAPVLAEVLEARDRLRARLSATLARPLVLVWLPPGDEASVAYRDVASLAGERLADDDPTLWLRPEPYPETPDAEPVPLAALADLSLLVAPGKRDADRALALLGEVLPATRALVLATGLPADRLERHPRLRVLEPPEDEPGGLLDALTETLAGIRRVTWWRALDPAAPPGDPLLLAETHASTLAVVHDDLCTFLLRLAERSPGKPERLLEQAGGGETFELRLQTLREAGTLEVVRGRARSRPVARRCSAGSSRDAPRRHRPAPSSAACSTRRGPATRRPSDASSRPAASTPASWPDAVWGRRCGRRSTRSTSPSPWSST
jgi:hypothetical protein